MICRIPLRTMHCDQVRQGAGRESKGSLFFRNGRNKSPVRYRENENVEIFRCRAYRKTAGHPVTVILQDSRVTARGKPSVHREEQECLQSKRTAEKPSEEAV